MGSLIAFASRMRTLNAKPDLEAYLRLNSASWGEWLAAVRELLHCSGMGCRLRRPKAVVGSLSALEVDAGRVCVLDVDQDIELTRCRLPQAVLVAQIQGRGEVILQGGSQRSTHPSLVILPGRAFTLRAWEGARLVLVSPLTKSVPSLLHKKQELALARHIHRFLLRSDYFQGHKEARVATTEFFGQLAQSLVTVNGGDTDELPELDRRLARAIEKIRSEPEWEFDLQALAQHSGASERNLYYLMKREAGMTPYRYYQRCRLIRVRRRLVDCQCDVPHISRYAADEGFFHLGRFAALYREHFGELPSETVQWRRRLQAYPAVEPPGLASV
ncbi:MAG: AraC family transcriptional regulator [Marinobacter sp.]